MMLEDMGHRLVGVARNKVSAIKLIEKGGFDFACLDVNLEGGIEGVELSELLRKKRVPFMFLTSYLDKYTPDQAKKTLPGAYISKPFTEEDIFTGLEMSLLHAGRGEDQTVHIRDGHKSFLFEPEKILYIKVDNVYIEIHTVDRKVASRQSFSAVMEKLPRDIFARVHRSYAVKKKIITIGKGYVQLETITIPLSKTYREEVADLLDEDVF
jgi:DNA-binding LytR/AlgR family response regulator